MKQISERVQLLNDKSENKNAKYVLYWMQMYKRTTHNHALKFAIEQANERDLPLVVYEGLKYYYPWASDRLHTFILEGVEEKRKEFEKLGITYVFYLQKDKNSPKQTVKKIAKDAALSSPTIFRVLLFPITTRRLSKRRKFPFTRLIRTA